VKVGVLLTWGKHIISLRPEIWAHNTGLTPPLFIEVPVSSK